MSRLSSVLKLKQVQVPYSFTCKDMTGQNTGFKSDSFLYYRI